MTASKQGMRVLGVSLGVLLTTGVLQAIVAVLSGSVALLADTIHNFSDGFTAVPLAVAFLLGRRPADRRFTYGYGRAEDLAGIVIVLAIAASAIYAGWEAVRHLIDPSEVEHVGWVAVAGVIGFAGNELVAVYRIRVGRTIGSAALVADGLHARTDGLTSLAVVVGAIGVALGIPLADPLIGLVITITILMVLQSAARDVLGRLMDSVDPVMVDTGIDALQDTEGVHAVEAFRLRWSGHRLLADATVTVGPDLSLATAHAVIDRAEANLRRVLPKLERTVIHPHPGPVDPFGDLLAPGESGGSR